jgi:hypothetical protein
VTPLDFPLLIDENIAPDIVHDGGNVQPKPIAVADVVEGATIDA